MLTGWYHTTRDVQQQVNSACRLVSHQPQYSTEVNSACRLVSHHPQHSTEINSVVAAYQVTPIDVESFDCFFVEKVAKVQSSTSESPPPIFRHA